MGSGTMTPIAPGAGAPFTAPIAEPLPRTHLSIARYARMMGVNPVHFFGAYTEDEFVVTRSACSDIWARYDWQKSDQVSRYQIADQISRAEEEIERQLGFHIAPYWTAEEVQQYPRYHRPEVRSLNGRKVDGRMKTIRVKWNKFIAPGPRATTYIDTATTGTGSLTYSDADGDGFYETATVAVTTTETNVRELRVYISGTNADPRWEIRPPKRKVISAGTVTFTFDSWLFIDPDIDAMPPSPDGFSAINIGSTANYVTAVDVYREYTDTTDTSAQFYWVPENYYAIPFTLGCSLCGGVGCEICGYNTQDGCIIANGVEPSIVTPQPGSYSEDDSTWLATQFTYCTEPTFVKLWYYSGYLSDEYLDGFTDDPLSRYWAETVMWLATARLERPFCTCGNAAAIADFLQTDIAYSGGDQSYVVDFNQLSNPFGTRKGEMMAWERISGLTEEISRFRAGVI